MIAPTIIAVVNHKGGVGKTTTVANAGYALARRGRNVLLVDFDSQADLSKHFRAERERSLYDAYERYVEETEYEIPVVTINDNLRLIPSNNELALLENSLTIQASDREFFLKEILERYCALNGAPEFVLIDCPPTLAMLTINALVAARKALVVTQTEPFAYEKLPDLIDLIKKLKRRVNPDLEIAGFLATMYDKRKAVHTQVLNALRTSHGEMVFQSVIRSNVACVDATTLGVPVIEYEAKSLAALDYINFADELLAQEEYAL